MTDTAQELIDLTQQLLDSIAAGNWETYTALCDETLTAYEPEARGQLVEGMDFHRYYFNLGGIEGASQTTIVSPHVRVLGDVAVVSYIRLIQHVGIDGRPQTARFEETRIWQQTAGHWRNVHFHRSDNGE